MNGRVTVAAVQASYVLLNREATLDRVEALVAEAARLGAGLVVFPEVFVPGTPLWIDSGRIWDGDGPWYARLVDQAVVVPPRRQRRGQEREPRAPDREGAQGLDPPHRPGRGRRDGVRRRVDRGARAADLRVR
ncbi:MAG TPA: nitrilase-related carbon-nitrogen hydrolase [Jiangellaceae bacterium]|nr:nitrilase-related carbon-nitrogen hydrolase [Jiangellaceae bacterium]